MRRTLFTLGTLALLSASAFAQQTFFASANDRLVRTDLNTFDTFTLSAQIHSLEFGPDGTLWATSRRDDDQDGSWTLYKVDDPFGTPTLNMVADGLEGPVPSLAFVGNTLYGLRIDSASDEKLVTINTSTGMTTPVGATGEIGKKSGALEYDPTTGNMYALDHNNPGLYTIDYTLSMGPDPAATLVGNFGIDGEIRSSGMAIDDGTGEAFVLFTLRGELAPRLYEVNKTTGAINEIADLSSPDLLGHGAGGTGLAVIPEPGSIGLLVLGSVLAAFRRR